MNRHPTKLAKIVSGLQVLTGVVGLIAVLGLFVGSDFDPRMGIIAILVMFIPIPYLIGAYGLWKGMKWGLVLSFVLNGLALFDFETESFSFYLTNGIYLNIEVLGIGVDLWSLLILVGLVVVAFQKRESNNPVQETPAKAAAPDL
jgi:hypothetical protein